MIKIKANSSNPSQYKTPTSFTEEETYAALRQDIMAELDAINLYEAHKEACKDKALKEILEHIIDEEKSHVKLLQDYLASKGAWDTKEHTAVEGYAAKLLQRYSRLD
jgi:rubrerythrin